MELLEGESLRATSCAARHRLAPERRRLRGRAVPQRPACGARPPASSIATLKPENIFIHHVGDDDHVKVLDFGVAKLTQSEVSDQHTTQGSARRHAALHGPGAGGRRDARPAHRRVRRWAMVLYELLVRGDALRHARPVQPPAGHHRRSAAAPARSGPQPRPRSGLGGDAGHRQGGFGAVADRGRISPRAHALPRRVARADAEPVGRLRAVSSSRSGGVGGGRRAPRRASCARAPRRARRRRRGRSDRPGVSGRRLRPRSIPRCSAGRCSRPSRRRGTRALRHSRSLLRGFRGCSSARCCSSRASAPQRCASPPGLRASRP
jgi:serine/threonine protein kinase